MEVVEQTTRRQTWRRIGIVTALFFAVSWIGLGVVPQAFRAAGYHTHRDQRVVTVVAFAVVAAGELIGVALVLHWLRRSGRSLRDIGWRKPTNAVAMVSGVAVALVSAAITLAWIRYYPHYPKPDLTEISAFKLVGVLGTAGVAAFAEEVVFRGWLMTELDTAGVRLPTQVLTSALAFGLFHGFAVIPAALLGGAWAIVYLLGRRSVTPSLASHVLVNLIMEPWFFLATVATQVHGH